MSRRKSVKKAPSYARRLARRAEARATATTLAGKEQSQVALSDQPIAPELGGAEVAVGAFAPDVLGGKG